MGLGLGSLGVEGLRGLEVLGGLELSGLGVRVSREV